MTIISYTGIKYTNIDYTDLSIRRERFNSKIMYKDDIIKHCGIDEAERTLENIRQCMCKGIQVIDLNTMYVSHAHVMPVKDQFNNVSSIYSI